MTIKPTFDLLRRLATDESGQSIAEYALVMTVLTVSMYVAYEYVAQTGNTSVTTNENNMSQMAAKAQ